MSLDVLIRVTKDYHIEGKFLAVVGGYHFTGSTELEAARKAVKYALEEIARLKVEKPEWFE